MFSRLTGVFIATKQDRYFGRLKEETGFVFSEQFDFFFQ